MPNSDGKVGQMSERGGPVAHRCAWCAAGPGILLAAVGVLALYSARELPVGTAWHLGPGAMSDVLAVLLLILSIVVAIEGLLRRQGGGGM